MPCEDKGQLKLIRESQADTQDIPQLFSQYQNRIQVFHYGGHADGQHLYFENQAGHSEGLADLFVLQQNMVLLFLNGCSTHNQAIQYLERGVPIVIATTFNISDQKAVYFAENFYDALAKQHTIKEAYEHAVGAIKLAYDNLGSYEASLVNYSKGNFGRKIGLNIPWQLYVNPEKKELLNWRIPKETSLPKYLTTVPVINEPLIGRTAEIQTIKNILNNSNKPLLINGIGGIGKTRLMIEYAHQYENYYRHFIWIDQNNDLQSSLIYNNILNKNLRIKPGGHLQTDINQLFNSIGDTSGPSLFIIDNANEEINYYKDQFKKINSNWHVLITSRFALQYDEIQLSLLTPEDAKSLFYTYYRREKDDRIVEKINEGIDYHTLTIELFAKTAQRRKLSLSKLHQIFSERGLALNRSAKGVKIAHDSNRQLNKIAPYLETIFDTGVLDQEELELLQLFIGLPPTFVTFELLTDLFGIDEKDEDQWDVFTYSLEQLVEKGWLTYDQSSDERYKIHKIIQEVVHKKLKAPFELFAPVISRVNQLLFINPSSDNPIDKFPFITFGAHLHQLFKDASHPDLSKLSSNLALLYQHKGQNQLALQLTSLALTSLQAYYGDKHIIVAVAKNNLATTCLNLNHFKEAFQLFNEALPVYKDHFGENSPEVAIIQSNVARAYLIIGKYELAFKFTHEALESLLKNLGPNHVQTLNALNTQALALKELGYYTEAAHQFELILEIDIQKFGPSHPNLIITLSHLGIMYQLLKKYNLSKELLEQALEMTIKLFGKDHPNVATRQSNLASIYKEIGKKKEAELLLISALQSDIKYFGNQHSNTATSLLNLGMIQFELGKIPEGIDSTYKAYQIFLAIFGPRHPQTITAKRILQYFTQ